ncbi:MAG: GNAT family N-acetyltransferase [Bacilli bacterium]|jgi:PhnO protein|nr:GNAT family N-acetyltransferase [Bacilli bacterium]
MKIDLARKEDLEIIYQIFIDLEGVILDKERFIKVFLNNINDTNITYLVARDNNEVIAFASIHYHLLLHHVGLVAELEELYVFENYRKQGIARKLVNKIIEEAKKKDCELIELASNIKRKEAHKFYEKIGFSKTHYKFTMKLKDIKNI